MNGLWFPTVDDLEFYREEGAVSKISDVVGAESMEHFIDAMRAIECWQYARGKWSTTSKKLGLKITRAKESSQLYGFA